MTDQHHGGCLCGAIRYQIEGSPRDAGYCHCRLCQKSGGAPLMAWATVWVEQFTYQQGTPAIYRSSPLGQREFCALCGTPLVFRLSQDPLKLDVTLPSLDHPEEWLPTYHIWHMSRIPWFQIGDTLPRYEGNGPDFP